VVFAAQAQALDATATAAALRLAGTITGGSMPASAPEFAEMVAAIQIGDNLKAATIAATSNYAASYLFRRLAFQMQNPALDASQVTDNDATAFLIAHFIHAAGAQGGISTLWYENATYLVNVTRKGVPTQVHAADLTASELSAINWRDQLVRVEGQTAKSGTGDDDPLINIPAKHVGGYLTLSDRANDNSFAMFGATAGTNLRMIEGMWTIATGLEVLDFASTSAHIQDVPRFVPGDDPNLFHGQGQNACIACHGGGITSLNHGYSTVADVFDFDPQDGLIYIANPTTNTMKSLASDPKKRKANAACNLVKTPTAVCNPDSVGADPNQGWDLTATWQDNGMLMRLGWSGLTQGQGLSTLGIALGQADIVYQNFTQRVIREVCPTSIFDPTVVNQIAADGRIPDDLRVIVAEVASNPACM
jgi:hypothetical protein